MNKPQRGIAQLVIDNPGSGAPDVSLGHMTLVAPFSRSGPPRSQDELRSELREAQINSIGDVLREFDVRIEGAYEGIDGSPVDVSIPATSEESFDLDGMTKADEGLMRMYVRTRTYESCTRALADGGREALGDDEVAHLEQLAQCLEESLKEQDNE